MREKMQQALMVGSILLLSGAVSPSGWVPTIKNFPAPAMPKALPPLHPWMALTFDDGPHPIMTEKLLALLRQMNVHATFFVVGKMADRYPRLVREIAQDGHELASHTYTHTNLCRLSNQAVLDELNRTRAVIQRLTGQDTTLFRPPGGDYSRRMLNVTEHAGYKMVLWDILTRDVEGASPQAMRLRIEKGAEDSAVILMHSGMKNTLEALPDIIAGLQKEGYHFVTVSTLFNRTHRIPRTPREPVALETASLSAE